jgi:hypothetical protein
MLRTRQVADRSQSKLERKRVGWVLKNPESMGPGELERAHRMAAVYRSTDELD